MRRAAALIGAAVGAVLMLTACGSSGGLIPASNANTISNDLSTLATALENHDCTSTRTALERIDLDVNALPSNVNPKLRTNIVEGYENLADTAPNQCRPQSTHASTGSTSKSGATSKTGATSKSGPTSSTGPTESTSPTGPTGTSIGPGGGSQAPTGSSGTGSTGSSGDSANSAGGAVSGA
jgi:hypothetical protein